MQDHTESCPRGVAFNDEVVVKVGHVQHCTFVEGALELLKGGLSFDTLAEHVLGE